MPDSFELHLRSEVRRWQQDFRQAAMVLYVQHVADRGEIDGIPDVGQVERMSAFTAKIADALHGQACSIITAQLAGYCRILKDAGYQEAADLLWNRHLPEQAREEERPGTPPWAEKRERTVNGS